MHTFSGHHGNVLKASKRSHKVQVCGPIRVEAMWRMEPQVGIPEHLPPLRSSASLSSPHPISGPLSSDKYSKATVLMGLRILLRVKMNKCGSVLPPTALLLPLHALRRPPPNIWSPDALPRAGLQIGMVTEPRSGPIPGMFQGTAELEAARRRAWLVAGKCPRD